MQGPRGPLGVCPAFTPRSHFSREWRGADPGGGSLRRTEVGHSVTWQPCPRWPGLAALCPRPRAAASRASPELEARTFLLLPHTCNLSLLMTLGDGRQGSVTCPGRVQEAFPGEEASKQRPGGSGGFSQAEGAARVKAQGQVLHHLHLLPQTLGGRGPEDLLENSMPAAFLCAPPAQGQPLVKSRGPRGPGFRSFHIPP